MEQLFKYVVMAVCLVIALAVFVLHSYDVLRKSGDPLANYHAPNFITVDLIIVGIIAALLIVIELARGEIMKAASPRKYLLTRLSIISGWLALISPLSFVAAISSPQESSAYWLMGALDPIKVGLLMYMSVPGLLLGLIAIISGVIAYKREGMRSALWGVIPGVIIAGVFLLFLVVRGGTPFLCVSDNACGFRGATNNGCYSYFSDTAADVLHPGTCLHYFHGVINLGNDIYTGQ